MTRPKPDQRRAYIETMRRSQPLAELQRKAAKAKRRGSGWVVEQGDVSLHASWVWDRTFAATATDPGGFCPFCHKFGIWDADAGRYVAGPIHTLRCTLAPDDGPYPGWAAAGRPREQVRAKIVAALPRPPSDRDQVGTPLSELSGRPGHPGFDRFCAIAASWGYP